MAADLLVFKRKNGTSEMKITKQMRNGYTPESVIIKVNLLNYKDVALFLHDLEDLYGVKIGKAVEQYNLDKERDWPF
jgi:hypothetical protein